MGRRTYVVAPVEPLDTDGVRTVTVGTALCFLGFLALIPFYGWLEQTERTWWLWVCLAGTGLGLLGLEYVRRRRDRRVAAAQAAEQADEVSATDGPDEATA
ncbi:DUF2530 domain-containing protein [Nocardioides sp. GY 10127]|nr:DUF2530 domain-containing protein [Nocardioides sp. GY 10127]